MRLQLFRVSIMSNNTLTGDNDDAIDTCVRLVKFIF